MIIGKIAVLMIKDINKIFTDVNEPDAEINERDLKIFQKIFQVSAIKIILWCFLEISAQQ